MAFGYDGAIRINTKLNSGGLKKGITEAGASLKKLSGLILSAFSAAVIVNFGKETVKAASSLSSAFIGLKSVVEGQGGSFGKAKSFIDSYIKDGLVPLENAVTAYKNLAMRGYDTAQIEQTMIALKDASAFGRQASLTMGEAVQSASEGLKNENSILVDNAGVTKNVSVMWKDYANSIDVGVQSLTKEQKIQAEVSGVMNETRFQVGDAAKATETYAGQVSMLAFNFHNLKVAVGNAIIPIAKAVLPGINAIISALTNLANVFAQVTAIMFGGETQGIAGGDAVKDQVEAEGEITVGGKEAADATDGLTDATEGMGDASKKAAKDMKGVLAGFDDLNVLANKAAGTMDDAAGELDGGLNTDKVGGGGELFGGAKVSPEILAFVNQLKASIQELLDMLKGVWRVFADAWNESGAQVIGAAKAALLSIWEMLKAIGAAFKAAWEGGAGERVLQAILTIITGILSFLAQLAAQVKQVFDEMGEAFFNAFFFALEAILNLIMSIGAAFAEAWNSGVGLEILRTIMSICTNIFNIIGEIAVKLQEAWEDSGNGVAIWTSILNIILDVLDTLDEMLAATLEWASGLDLEPLVSSFRGLLEAIEPLVAIILDGLSWAYTNVLLPLAGWALEDAAPAVIDLLSAAIELLCSVLDALKPLGEWLWESFLKPIAEWTGGVIIWVLESITDALVGVSDWISGNKGSIEAVTATVLAFFSAWSSIKIAEFLINAGGVPGVLDLMHNGFDKLITKIFSCVSAWGAHSLAIAKDKIETLQIIGLYAKDFVSSIWATIVGLAKSTVAWVASTAAKIANTVAQVAATAATFAWNAICAVATVATTALGAAFTFITSPIGLVVLAIAAVIAIVVAAVTHWEELKEVAGMAWDFIVEKWNAAGEWMQQNVLDPIVDGFKNAINFLNGIVEGFVNFFVGGVNLIINALNTISFDVPEWVPLIGGKSFGFDIPNVPTMNIPKLASGAVIPPNQQFAAILGDQTSGYNVEAPVSMIEQAVARGMAQGGGTRPVEIHIRFDGELAQMARLLKPVLDVQSRLSGASLVVGV